MTKLLLAASLMAASLLGQARTITLGLYIDHIVEQDAGGGGYDFVPSGNDVINVTVWGSLAGDVAQVGGFRVDPLTITDPGPIPGSVEGFQSQASGTWLINDPNGSAISLSGGWSLSTHEYWYSGGYYYYMGWIQEDWYSHSLRIWPSGDSLVGSSFALYQENVSRIFDAGYFGGECIYLGHVESVNTSMTPAPAAGLIFLIQAARRRRAHPQASR